MAVRGALSRASSLKFLRSPPFNHVNVLASPLTSLLNLEPSASSNWSVCIKLGSGYYCSNFCTRAYDDKSRHPFYGGITQNQAGRKPGSKAVTFSEDTIVAMRKVGFLTSYSPLGQIFLLLSLTLGSWIHKQSLNLCMQNDSEVDQNRRDTGAACSQVIGANISAAEKRKFLIDTLLDLKDSKEAVYGTLDAWVAWEPKFPLVSLKRALLVLQKEQQWHQIVQIIKWMLSKGQGTTVGTYEQLIRALEKDNRAEEAHKIWVKKISHDLHSVPWRVCDLMISIYYRNNMLERLVKLFKGLESYDRRPPTKSIVQKVADAYEVLGLLEEKAILLEKYSDVFSNSSGRFKKSRKTSRKNEKKGTESHKSPEVLDDRPMDSGPSDDEIE